MPKQKWPVVAVVCALALIAGLAAMPSVASAIPSKAVLEADRARIMSELDVMRMQLQSRIDQYTITGRDLEQTQAEIDQVSAQLVEVKAELARSRRGLALRAAELYRGDQVGMIEVLLGSQNIEDLIIRAQFLILISQHDANALNDARLMQSESLWLRDSLNRRLDRLTGLQAQADAERIQIQADITEAENRAALIDADIAELLRQSLVPTSTASGTFNPDTVITDANFRSQDMTATGVQEFLDRQVGPLKGRYFNDHTGVRKSAAEIIADAAEYYHISPRVILVTLQKEQSLLSTRPTKQDSYDWAMGCGVPDSGVLVMKYKGFGNQVWGGAQKLDKAANAWIAGTEMTIDSSMVYPTNWSTFALYKYTPHVHGVTSFWTLWIRYFNSDPST